MTDGRAEVGFLEDEGDDRHGDDQERHGAALEPGDSRPSRRHPVGEVDDQGRAWRSRRDGPPAANRSPASAHSRRRRRLRLGTKTRISAPTPTRYAGSGHEPEEAIVDAHHHEHRHESEGGPHDLRSDDRQGIVRTGCTPASPTTSRPSGSRSRRGRRPRPGSTSPAGADPAGGHRSAPSGCSVGRVPGPSG